MFQVSPGVQVNEIDMSNVIPTVSTSIGGYAGVFPWGPVGTVVQVSSEDELGNVYVTPTLTTNVASNTGSSAGIFAQSFLTAASFLKYGNTLKVSRSVGADTLNAVSSGSAIQIGNLDQFNAASIPTAQFVARYPGACGNSIVVYVLTKNTIRVSGDGITSQFDAMPVNADEIHILIIDALGYLTGTPGTILEKYQSVSILTNSIKFDGTSNYYKTVINNSSSYIWANKLADFGGADSASPAPITVPNVAYTTVRSVTVTSTSGTSGSFVIAGSTGSMLGVIPGMTIAGAGSAGFTVTAVTSNSVTLATALTTTATGTYTASGVYSTFLTVSTASGIAITNAGTGSTVMVSGAGIPEGARVSGVSGNLVYITAPIGVEAVTQALSSPIIFRAGGTLTPMATSSATAFSLTSGADGVLGSITGTTAVALLADAETVDVNLLFCSETVDQVGVTEQSLIQTAITRKDCVAFISAPLSVKDQTSEANKLAKCTNGTSGKFDTITRSSYVVFDSGPLYVYNKYQDNYTWIPASGHIAGLCASTDTVAEPWFSPAGYQRGQLLGTTKLGFNPNQASRDTLYKAGVNPIVTFPGQGTILFGDKTGQAKPSAFDRINVRRLFIVLEKAIATAAKYQLFELNDSFTQAMFRNMVEPYLRDIKGRRGITDFLVVCDSTNNTGAVVDSNQFVADIYIKPARSINFITLNFIATRTSVSFSEIAGTKNQ